MREFLASWSADLRKLRDWRNLLDAEAAQSIAADLAVREQALAGVAYTAEQADLEAVKLLEKAKEGGLDNSDLPLIARALRHIRRSAAHDHTLSEAAKP